ncbi:MAG: helix-turn-helix domain-containing protein [Chitinispirillaceae bacterium]|nr:helix-turn-helix domain-containing protein [Chitinispirillaceae bacterium]
MGEEKEIINTEKAGNTLKKKIEKIIWWIGRSVFKKEGVSNSEIIASLKYCTKKLLFFILPLVIILSSLYFYRQNEEKKRFLTTTRLSVMDKEVQRACNYIEKNFNDPNLNRESVCKALITGEAFLEALFLKELGISVEDFISYVRINRAKIFLQEEKNVEIETLATRCGFSDSIKLREIFERITGGKIEEYIQKLNSVKGDTK